MTQYTIGSHLLSALGAFTISSLQKNFMWIKTATIFATFAHVLLSTSILQTIGISKKNIIINRLYARGIVVILIIIPRRTKTSMGTCSVTIADIR